MQIAVPGNTHAHQRPEKCGVGIEKSGRKVAMRHQVLRPVEILEEQIEQLGALNDARFDEAPLVRRNQQRNDIDLPGPACPEWIAVNVVRDPVLANAPLSTGPASSQFP